VSDQLALILMRGPSCVYPSKEVVMKNSVRVRHALAKDACVMYL